MSILITCVAARTFGLFLRYFLMKSAMTSLPKLTKPFKLSLSNKKDPQRTTHTFTFNTTILSSIKPIKNELKSQCQFHFQPESGDVIAAEPRRLSLNRCAEASSFRRSRAGLLKTLGLYHWCVLKNSTMMDGCKKHYNLNINLIKASSKHFN